MKINFYTGTIDHQFDAGSGGVQFVLSKICSSLSEKNVDIKIISCFAGDKDCPSY
jgi:hypothetical protein